MSELGLILCLSHELGVALEMSYDGEEMNEVWPEALDALREVSALLNSKGFAVPEVVGSVLRAADEANRS